MGKRWYVITTTREGNGGLFGASAGVANFHSRVEFYLDNWYLPSSTKLEVFWGTLTLAWRVQNFVGMDEM